MGASANSRIQAAAAGLLEDEASRAHYSALIEGLYAPIDRGLASALSVYDSSQVEAVVHGFFSEFLQSKVRSRAFLEGIVASDYPERYAARAASNFARDEIRKNPLLENSGPVETDDGEHDQLEHLQDEDAVSAAQALEAAQEQEGRRAWLEDLPIDDQLLLGVLFVEARDLPDRLLHLLAKRRAMEVEDVRSELEQRAGDQGNRRSELRQELDARAGRIFSLQRAVSRVRAAIRQRDQVQAEPAELSSDQLRILRASQTALLEASAEERSGYQVYLEARISHLCELQVDNRDRLQREFPAGPKYEEVLSILGQLPVGADDRRKAINALTVRYRRIRKRLRQRLDSEESGR